jgi:hypothetical protein
MTPTYPSWELSAMTGIVKAKMEIFNKRKDVEYYEISVTDEDGNPVHFVTKYKIVNVKYLQHMKFDVYVRYEDKDRARYICSRSKLKGEDATAMLASKICSKIR